MESFRLDSIKKAARKEAWYNRDGDEQSRAYNPFARHDARPRRVRDEESARGAPLEHVQSENGAGPSPIESRRRGENEYTGPAKSGTFPPDDSGNHIGLQSKREENGEFASSEDTSKDSSDRPYTNGTNKEVPNGVNEPNGVARKRKHSKFKLPWKKNNDGDEDFPRRDTTDSKKKKKKHAKIPVMNQFKAVFFSWINILLVAVPVGIALEYAGVNKVIVFVVNFIAIIPLAAMLSYSTEELAMYIGETLGGLLNATFGNAVELIVSIIALIQGKILIVQTSLLGSMLSNLLLVLGMCFFAGGLRRTEQFFNLTVAQTASSLLALAIGSLIIPTAFVTFAISSTSDPDDIPSRITPVSRGVAVMLLFVYACYLYFQLSTHNDMYNEPSKKVDKRPSKKKAHGDVSKGIAIIGAGTGAAYAGGGANQENLVHEEDGEEEGPQLSIVGAVVTLAISTVFIALCAEYMVSSINAVAESVSPEFIGLILLPIVGNAAEHATAVTVAIKDKMDLSIGVAVGSSLQIALLVLPVMVLLNWFGLGAPADLTMSFDGFQVACLFIAIIVVNYVVQDGKSHWLEGIMLMVAYLIIALSAWFYPATGDVAG